MQQQVASFEVPSPQENLALEVTQKETSESIQMLALPSLQKDIPVELDGILTPPLDLPSPIPHENEAVSRNFAVKSSSKPIKPPEKSPDCLKTSSKHPEKQQGSITEYKTKTSLLKPASAYANPSNRPKVPISIPYKKTIAPKPDNDPKNDAVKLMGIKDKIYKNLFLKSDQKASDKETTVSSDLNNSNASSELTETKLRRKTKRSYTELSEEAKDTSDSKEEEYFQQLKKKKGNENSALASNKNVPKRATINSKLGKNKTKEPRRRRKLNVKLRKKPKQSYAEPLSETTDEEDYFQIPIQKSQTYVSRRKRSAVKNNANCDNQATKRVLRKQK